MKAKRIRRYLSWMLIICFCFTSSNFAEAAAKPTVTAVKTQKELNKAIADKKISVIRISTDKKVKFTISASKNTENKNLIVDAGNATIVNNANFKSISLEKNGAKSFYENGKNNEITVSSKKASFYANEKAAVKSVTLKGNAAKVYVKKGAVIHKVVTNKNNSAVDMTVTGTVKNIYMNSKTNLNIWGSTKNSVNLFAKAEDSAISTSVKTNFALEKSAAIIMKKGSEGSVVKLINSGTDAKISNNTNNKITVETESGEKITVDKGEAVESARNKNTESSEELQPEKPVKPEIPGNPGGSGGSGNSGDTGPELITLNETKVQILADTTYQLTAAVKGDYNNTIIWTSSNTEAATVDNTGLVKAATLESLKGKTKNQRTTKITASVNGKSAVCTLTVGPIEVYFYQSNSYDYKNEPFKLFQAQDGVSILWEEEGQKNASFHQPQYVEGLTQITFDLELKEAENVEMSVQYKNRFYTEGSADNIFEYKIPSLQSGLKKTITINTSDFTGNFSDSENRETQSAYYTGNDKKAYQISQFDISLKGNNPKLNATISNFKVFTKDNDPVNLFDASEFQSVFQKQSEAYIEPASYDNVRKPRVLIADHAKGVWDRLEEYIALSKEWPEGSFGVDLSVMMYGSNRELIDRLHKEGIKTMYEINKTFPYYTHYVESNDDYLVRQDGKRNSPYFFPAHGEDITQAATYKAMTSLLDEAKNEGYTEYLLVDYTWPWDGRWGYGAETVQAFRDSLNGVDEGMYVGDGNGGFHHMGFWEYLKVYNDYQILPGTVANFDPLKDDYSKVLNNWDEFVPVSEAQASISGDMVKRNLYLFNALWHYEHLKLYQKLGDYADSIGLSFFASFNTEDTMNGTDTYFLGMLRNVDKVGYEYFGDPGANTSFYHTMRYYTENMRNNGHDMTLIGEINETGHGPSKYSWDVSYAYYYGAVTASKPIDYNNQYISDGNWDGISTYDSIYHFDRYASWYAGAAAFFQTYKENGDRLQAKKDTALVASRSVLEYQGGSVNSFSQTGNIAKVLDDLKIPFDSVGKEGFYKYVKDAKTLVYCPADTAPMHEKDLKDYLANGSGKTLVTHSFVPFAKSTAIIDLTSGRDEDLTWDGEGNWSTALNAPRVSKDGILGLSLDSAASTVQNLSFSGNTAPSVNVYTLSGNNAETLVYADDNKTPLISRINYGSNKIIYINADISKKGSENAEFNRAVAAKAMEFTSNVKSEAIASPSMAVHIYDVPGGKSTVLWDTDTFDAQRKNSIAYAGTQKFKQFFRTEMELLTTPIEGDPEGRYHTVAKPAETVTICNLKPNTEYVLYDFINNKDSMQRSNAKGEIFFTTQMSTEMFYFGEAGEEFSKTIAEAKETRQKLERFNEKVPTAAPMETVLQENPDQNLLVFQGGMEGYYINNTDGTTATFEGWDDALNNGEGGWYKIGKNDFKGMSMDDTENVLALPLGTKSPKKIRLVVNKNMHTSYDSTVLKKFEVINSNREVITNYLESSITETGVYAKGQFNNDKQEFINSGSLMKLTTEIVFHPPWGKYDGQCVYGVFEDTALAEAKALDTAKAENPESQYFLIFKGGMDAGSPDTDGVTLTFDGRNNAMQWNVLGKKNLDKIFYNSYGDITANETIWALPLGNIKPNDVRITVSKNATTANDAVRLVDLAVVDRDNNEVVNFMEGTLSEVGLAYLGEYKPAVVEDAAMKFEVPGESIFLHPTYGPNANSDIYGVFSKKRQIIEAGDLNSMIASYPDTKCFITFKGGMDASSPNTDGVTLTFSYQNDNGIWEKVGVKNLNSLYYNSAGDITADETTWAIPLEAVSPGAVSFGAVNLNKIRVEVDKNANTGNDAVRLTEFRIVSTSSETLVDFMKGEFTEIGLKEQEVYTKLDTLEGLDAAMQFEPEKNTIFLHPTYGPNSSKNIYGIIEVK